jgi:hypothetical protein
MSKYFYNTMNKPLKAYKQNESLAGLTKVKQPHTYTESL